MKTAARTILVCLAAFAPTAAAKEIAPMTKAESYVLGKDLLARRRVGTGCSPTPPNVACVERLVDIG